LKYSYLICISRLDLIFKMKPKNTKKNAFILINSLL
jgi:hypothetical protein